MRSNLKGGVPQAAFAFGLVVAALAAATPARADMVLDWNRHASDALINSPSAPVPGAGYTPPVAGVHMAIVQGAVYDAVNSIDGGHEPYLAGLPARPSASQRAAAATAAHHVLVGLAPALPASVRARLDSLYAASLGEIADDAAEDEGIAAGRAAAHAMLDERADDGRFGPFRFSTGTGPGQWRPTSTPPVNDPFAWVARVRPFAVASSSQFRTEGPHALTSAAYAAEYDEVRRMGVASDSERTPEQTALATFYTAHPVELWNRTFRTIAAGEGLSLSQQARLFAMANMAGADAFITAWDDKAHWGFWRPVTAIRAGDDDGNPATTGHPGWTPLVASPPYPDHPSAYNSVTAGFLYTARQVLGPRKLEFSVHNRVIDRKRTYSRFADVVKDTIDARIYAGLHFRAADEQAAWVGKKVAQWLDKHYFEPAS